MLFKSGSFTGNGVRASIRLGFRPRAVLAKADTTAALAFWAPGMWCERSGSLGTVSSYISGLLPNDDGFVVGSSALWNTSGVTTHYIAIGDDGSDDFDLQSWCGDQAAGRVIPLQVGKTPIAAIIKRDSNLEAVLKFGSNTVFAQGTAAADCIAFGSGEITLSAEIRVNQYDSAGGLGEGIDGLVFFDSSNCRVVSWTGNGTAGRVIATGVSSPVAALVQNPNPGGSSRLVTTTMAGKAGPVTAGSALTSNEMSIAGGSLVIGSNATVLNAVGMSYSALVWAEKSTLFASGAPPAVKIKNKQAVYLPANGLASYIDCGVSDATLLIDGDITYEWCGAQFFNPTAAAIVDGIVISRGPGAYGNVNGYSWSLLLGAINDGALGWSNVQWCPQSHNLMGMAAPLDTSNWRTGIIAKFGQIQHVIASINGAGGVSFLQVDGKVVKWRRNATPQIDSVAGHRTVIGCRMSGASYVRNTKLLVREVAIYNAALTVDEARARYERAMLGSTAVADVTSSRAAWWNADNAGGTAMPDVVNAANNGTISAGVIVTL